MTFYTIKTKDSPFNNQIISFILCNYSLRMIKMHIKLQLFHVQVVNTKKDLLNFTKAFNERIIVNKSAAIKVMFVDAGKGSTAANAVDPGQRMCLYIMMIIP